jgi:hypothetical protein
VDVQITKWLHLSSFFFKSAGEGEGVVWGWPYLINSLHKKTPKNTDSQPAVLLNSFKFCAPVVFVWFWLFFSCFRRKGGGGGGYKRGSDITNFFPNIAFYFCYYHKMNCHTNCVTFLAFLTTYFDEHFFWKEIFQWYFVGTGI